MAECKYCDTPIRYILLDETPTTKTWSKPMVLTARSVMVTEDEVKVTETFTPHECHQELEAQLKDQQAWRLAQSARDSLEELAKRALENSCPSCRAKSGEPCMNLTARRRKQEIPTVWPHAARMALVESSTDEG